MDMGLSFFPLGHYYNIYNILRFRVTADSYYQHIMCGQDKIVQRCKMELGCQIAKTFVAENIASLKGKNCLQEKNIFCIDIYSIYSDTLRNVCTFGLKNKQECLLICKFSNYKFLMHEEKTTSLLAGLSSYSLQSVRSQVESWQHGSHENMTGIQFRRRPGNMVNMKT